MTTQEETEAMESAERLVRRCAPKEVTRTPLQIDAYNVARALLSSSKAARGMREALEQTATQLKVVLMWVDNWAPVFVQEDEWQGDRKLANAAVEKALAALTADPEK